MAENKEIYHKDFCSPDQKILMYEFCRHLSDDDIVGIVDLIENHGLEIKPISCFLWMWNPINLSIDYLNLKAIIYLYGIGSTTDPSDIVCELIKATLGYTDIDKVIKLNKILYYFLDKGIISKSDFVSTTFPTIIPTVKNMAKYVYIDYPNAYEKCIGNIDKYYEDVQKIRDNFNKCIAELRNNNQDTLCDIFHGYALEDNIDGIDELIEDCGFDINYNKVNVYGNYTPMIDAIEYMCLKTIIYLRSIGCSLPDPEKIATILVTDYFLRTCFKKSPKLKVLYYFLDHNILNFTIFNNLSLPLHLQVSRRGLGPHDLCMLDVEKYYKKGQRILDNFNKCMKELIEVGKASLITPSGNIDQIKNNWDIKADLQEFVNSPDRVFEISPTLNNPQRCYDKCKASPNTKITSIIKLQIAPNNLGHIFQVLGQALDQN